MSDVYHEIFALFLRAFDENLLPVGLSVERDFFHGRREHQRAK
jgi:hypothetical protein